MFSAPVFVFLSFHSSVSCHFLEGSRQCPNFFACIITTGIFYRPSPSKNNFLLALIVGFKTLFDCLREENTKKHSSNESFTTLTPGHASTQARLSNWKYSEYLIQMGYFFQSLIVSASKLSVSNYNYRYLTFILSPVVMACLFESPPPKKILVLGLLYKSIIIKITVKVKL